MITKDEIEELNEAIRNNDTRYLTLNRGLALKLVKSPNKEDREIGWKIIEILIKEDYRFSEKEKNVLKSLLWDKLQGVRDYAWSRLYIYKELEITGFEKILSAKSDKVKWSAWSHVIDLIQLSLMNANKVQKSNYAYWRLLRSYYPTIRKKAWRLFPQLVNMGIIQIKENAKQKGRYLEFLKYPKFSVRLYAWESVVHLIENNIIAKEEVLSYVNYLQELTTVNNKQFNKRAKKILLFLKESRNYEDHNGNR